MEKSCCENESKSNWENVLLGVTSFTHLGPSAIQAMQPE